MEKKVCTKTRFANEEAAKHTIKQIAKKNQERKRPTRCYKCENCGLWHLTSLPDYDLIIKDNETLKKDNETLKKEIEELKSKIEELNNKLKPTKEEKTPFQIQEAKEFRKAIRKETMYKGLREQITAALARIKSLYTDRDQLLVNMVKLQNENERLRLSGSNDNLAKSA